MARLICKVMGAVFVVVAIWGFITGDSVLIFHVNAAHNLVHAISGLGALACGFVGERASRLFALIFGSVYGLVAVLGFAGVQAVVDLLHLNTPDNWLHLAIAAVFIGAALIRAPVPRLPSASTSA
jgi:hypothetical protein